MRSTRFLPLLLGLASGLSSGCRSTGGGEPDPSAAAQFERLKTLEGEWVAVADGSDVPAGTLVRYEVTSGGSALVETLFVGSPEEMVTVYHLDGGRLALTHYCSLANQPRMLAEPSGDADHIRFRFAGGTNLEPSEGSYMGEAEFTFVDDARFRAQWTLWKDGKRDHSARFALVRSWR